MLGTFTRRKLLQTSKNNNMWFGLGDDDDDDDDGDDDEGDGDGGGGGGGNGGGGDCSTGRVATEG